MSTVFGDDPEITSPSAGKTTNDNTICPYVHWLELINERDNPIDLDKLRQALINSVFPIIYNTNNKDILDIANWAPCILRKVHKEQYEILDQNEQDKLDKDLDWEGDDCLSALWDV
jgi:hypothetical protein